MKLAISEGSRVSFTFDGKIRKGIIRGDHTNYAENCPKDSFMIELVKPTKKAAWLVICRRKLRLTKGNR